jgi:hypothetical protein
VQFELGAAWGLNKFIIPVVTSEDVIRILPVELSREGVIELSQLKKPDVMSQIFKSYEKTAA